MSQNGDLNVNQTVNFSTGQVPGILNRLEQFLGIPLSLRSITGETVVKTDYFYGPCSIVRGTESGRLRCRRTYHSIEDKLLRRKVPFVSFCYAGFLIFSVPLNFRGEMIGTLLGSQILPQVMPHRIDLEPHFGGTCQAVQIKNSEAFYASFNKVRYLDPDFPRVSFLEFLEKIGEHFTEMAFSEKSWARFHHDIHQQFPLLEKFRAV